MFNWLLHTLIFANRSGKYKNKEKSLKRQRKLGLMTKVCQHVLFLNLKTIECPFRFIYDHRSYSVRIQVYHPHTTIS